MKKAALISVFSVFLGTLSAEEAVDANATQQAVSQPTATPQVNTRPQFRGVLRVRYEYDFNENISRFNVRNARALVAGNVNHWVSYQVQADLSNNGVFQMLDMDIRFRPTENLTVRVGQTFLPFIQPHSIGPGQILFANRSFANRYLSGGSRDIGILANYRFSLGDIPVSLCAALFNGAGINNPRWTKTNELGRSFRAMFGRMDHVRVALKSSNAVTPSLAIVGGQNVKSELYGIDFRYFNNGFMLEAEAVRATFRWNRNLDGIDEEVSRRIGMYLQASQIFRIEREWLKYIQPAVRWDMMGLANRTDFSDVNRLTLALNFGLDQGYRRNEIRVNFEKYFVDRNKTELYFGRNNTAWHDKITLEFLMHF